MSKHPRFLRGTSSSLTALLIVGVAAVTQSQLLGREAARLDGYTQPDGTNVFALELKPSATADNGPREVVILVCTAASQTGDYREKSLAALQSTLSRLTPNDRVKLVAFDLDAVPLTEGFVAPQGPEMNKAVTALQQRTPLGSTDLEKALDATIKSFPGDGKMPRAVVYIGDGSSRANLLTPDQLDKIARNLVAEHIPVTTLGVGPRIDQQILGVLAARTGGVAMHESTRVDGDAIGVLLADAVRGTVVWPKADGINLPAGVEVYPKTLPPMRNDRETVFVGTAKAKSPLPKQLEIDLAGGQKLTWDLPELKSDAKNGYLASVVDQAKVDGGRTLPLVDMDSLSNIKREVEVGGHWMYGLADVALKGGQFDKAAQLADEALRHDPNDKDAMNVKKDAAAKKDGGGTMLPVSAAAPPPPLPVNPPTAAGNPGDIVMGGDNPGLPPSDGAAADAQFNNTKAIVQQLDNKVRLAIDQARKQVSVYPEAAAQIIQQAKLDVQATNEASEEDKDRLQRMLYAAGLDVGHRAIIVQKQRQEAAEAEAVHREMEMVGAQFQHDNAKIKQLFDRYDALLAEGRGKLAEEAIMDAKDLIDRSVPSAKPDYVAGLQHNRSKVAFDEIMAIRTLRQRGFVDTLFQVEKSHVPTPDEPPIVYPDSEWWREMSKRRKEKYGSMDLKTPSAAEKKISEALKQPTTIEFVETPLKEVVDYLKDLHHIEIQLDAAALKDAGIEESAPITKNLKGISLRSALHLLLDELKLKYVIHNEVLLITSPERAESDEFMTTKVYPVADIVLPIPQGGVSGFGGLGGGMGGGMGMSGGMGGMGMGGMGMGGMGGGMGGMGGGFMNVPREIIPRQKPLTKLFAVPPEAVGARTGDFSPNTSEQPAVETAKTEQPSQAEKIVAVEPIRLNLAPGADVRQAWEDFFAKHQIPRSTKKLTDEEIGAQQRKLLRQQQAVLQTVQALKDEAKTALEKGKQNEVAKKHEEIIALIEAALRHDQTQPWMYECLALSMKAVGRPQADIERAVMSAVDYTQSSADLMYIGAYLVRADLDRRALQVFRQVSQLEPLWPEPYFNGLTVARHIDDLAGLEWAASGILSQAWPPAQAKMWDDALRAASAKLEDLRKQQRNEEADHFSKTINEALVRDCVVRVQWTGDADIDVMIKEPAGTICSLRNQRTTSGGVLSGDASAADGKEKVEGHTAVYACPKAFSGKYQILVRRVFGNVPTGYVRVVLNMHYNTPKATETVWDKIPVKDGESLITFDLADGRRVESLHQVQVANAAVAALGQLQVQQAVLAQQLAASNDQASASTLATVQKSAAAAYAADSQQSNPLAFWPKGMHGAVGYQPVITTLPEGTNLGVTGVVSADRRYVRITPQPVFSSISKVDTFNMASGSSGGGSGGGGMGGGGMGGMGGGGMGGMGGGGMGGMGGGGMGGMGGMGGGMGGMGGGMGGMGGGMGMGGGFM